ncbi:hypothetical protein [Streptomyces sp. NBC_00343]|uniref:hypothetical protein n=1 Tax=Streptomyces sp. NBC_00343 TaxID=2975719 RepID=UPI002E2E0023|nr:hypothetical protein [Streptomyces sp. NBC_00343]
MAKKQITQPVPGDCPATLHGQLDVRIGRHVHLHVYVSPTVLAALLTLSGTLGGALALLR